MIYYIVAILDPESYICIEKLQKNISGKFDLYNDLPRLYMTLETIDNPNIDELILTLNSILKKYHEFSIDIDGAICFKPPYKSVNLNVLKTKPITSIIKEINYTLKTNNFNVRSNVDEWDLHISIANSYFAKRDWSEKEFSEACTLLHKNAFKRKCKIIRIELWKPINDKNSMIIKSYKLKKDL